MRPPHRRLVSRLLQAIAFAAAVFVGFESGLEAADLANPARATVLETLAQASQPSTPVGIRLALLSEENIPAPGAASAMASPGAVASPLPGSSAEVPLPGAAPAPGAAIPGSGLGAPGIDAQPAAIRTEVPPMLDVTGAVSTVQISDGSLVPEFATAISNPARAASIRTVERARQEIIAGHAEDAIHLLTRSLSIDPTDPYSYFYLGRAYLIKKNYSQALTFFQRAGIGFTANPAWLGESCAFEGLAYEETGRLNEAAGAYRRALQASPSNRIGLTGYGRLAALGYGGVTDASLRGGPAPPPSDSVIAPAPAMAPPPPPPAEPPAPTD